MGEVYKAHDPRLGRFVAVKILLAQKLADANQCRRFQQEARAASALNHPGISDGLVPVLFHPGGGGAGESSLCANPAPRS